MFLNVCGAFFWKFERKWSVFIVFDISGCILIRIWKRYSNHSIFLLLPATISVSIVVGLSIADNVWGRRCEAMPAVASARLMIGLPESEFCFRGVSSTTGKVLSGEMCVLLFCGWVNYNGLIRIRVFFCGRLSLCHHVMSVRSLFIVRSQCRKIAVLEIFNITNRIVSVLINV